MYDNIKDYRLYLIEKIKLNDKKVLQYLLNEIEKNNKILIYHLSIILNAYFECYLIFIFYYINSNTITLKKFHLDIITELENIVFLKNEFKNLCLNIPPGSGKSLLIEYFISWCFARSVDTTFLYVSHSNKLIERLSREIKSIVETEYWKLFFKSELQPDEKGKLNWSFSNSKNRTGLMASTITGAITGHDAGNSIFEGFSGALIIDDPSDAGNIFYENHRKEIIYIFNNKLKTRLRTPTTPIILIMQRLHIEDLTGYILENEKENWKFIIIPALDNNANSLWEEKYPTEELKKLQLQDNNNFQAQYQQNPTLDGGNLFKMEWFEINGNIPNSFDFTFITGDTANKEKEQNDFSVFSYFGVLQNRLYLIDVIREKLQAVDIENWCSQWIKNKIQPRFRYLWIEDKGSGIYLNQQFRRKGYPIPDENLLKKTLPRDKDKVLRANNILPIIDKINKNIIINKNINCLTDLITEIISFPNGRHDDFVDTFIDGIQIGLFKKQSSWFD